MTRVLRHVIGGLLAVGLSTAAAQANLLLPGGLVAPDLFGAIPGTVVASVLNTPFVSDLGASDFSGTYSTVVVRETGADAVCPTGGCLDFVYQAKSAGPTDIATVSMSIFSGFLTDVGLASSAGGLSSAPGDIAPTFATRTTTGSAIDFDFDAPFFGVATSDVLVIETNAVNFAAGDLSFINDGTSTNPAFEPVPEPGSLALLGTALIGLWFVLRRKKPPLRVAAA